jgi:hypothetical protein
MFGLLNYPPENIFRLSWGRELLWKREPLFLVNELLTLENKFEPEFERMFDVGKILPPLKLLLKLFWTKLLSAIGALLSET